MVPLTFSRKRTGKILFEESYYAESGDMEDVNINFIYGILKIDLQIRI